MTTTLYKWAETSLLTGCLIFLQIDIITFEQRSLFENVGLFPQVWSHHPQPQELEPVRPTNHQTNIGRCC